MDIYLSPQGNDDKAGVSPESAWRTLAKLNSDLPDWSGAGHVRVLFRAGGAFPGTWELTRLGPVSVGVYDGDAPATIQSGSGNAVNYSGDGGLSVRNLRLAGAGVPSQDLHVGLNVNAVCRDVEIENVEATGYGFAGVMLAGGEVDGVTLRDCHLHKNGNGFFTSGPKVRNVKLLHSEVDHNDLPHRWGSGFGVSINGTESVEVADCHVHHNGLAGGGGCSGVMLYLCRHGRVRHNVVTDNHDPYKTDAQGIVVDDSWDVLVEYNDSLRNRIGIEVHDEFLTTPPRAVTVRGNVVDGCTVGLSSQGGAGGVLWDGNEVTCLARGEYMTALDLHRPNATRFRGNRFRAEDGAWLLSAALGPGGATFARDEWTAKNPLFVSRGRGFTTLTALLAAEPLTAAARARKSRAVKLLPGTAYRAERKENRLKLLKAVYKAVRA